MLHLSHLDPERLAALADGEPAADESAHLAQCAACARELSAHRALLSLAADARAVVSPPVTSWDSLAQRMNDEKVFDGVNGAIGHSHWPSRTRTLAQAAAAIVLVAGGVLAGRRSVHIDGVATGASTAQRGDASFASLRGDTAVTVFKSPDEARKMLEAADRQYQVAAAYLATMDTATHGAPQPEIYRTRLAALDAVAGVARAAVNEAPQDPVINQYYLSAISARQVALRQLGNALPTGQQLTGF
ncbi:MAG: hypothetical protein ABJD07_13885 [Gemmatimonadaceae bacterium]